MAASPLLHSLPVGYRFRPSEEELVFSYLLNRTSGQAYAARPLLQLPEVNVLRCDPSSLPSDACFDGEWFFFYRPSQHGSKKERSVKCGETVVGFWKSTGNDHAVRLGGSKSSSNNGQKAPSDGGVTGMKKKLVYYSKSGPSDHKGSKTDWIMDEYRLEVETGSDLAALVLCRVFIKGNVAPPNAPRNPPSFAPASPNVSAATVSRPMSPAPSLTLGAFAEHVTMAKGQIVTDDYDTVNSVIQAKKMSAPGAAASAAAMGGGDAERFVDLLLAKDEVESGTTGGDNHGCADDEERLLLNTMMDAIIIDDGDRSDKSGSDDVTASVQLVSEAFVDSSVEDSGRFVSGNGAGAMDAEGSGQFGGFQSQHGSTTDLPGACNGNSSMAFEKLTSASYENISMAESQCAPAAAGTWKVPRSPRMVSTDTVGPNAGVNTGVNGGATGGAIGGAAAAAVATPSLASGFSAADLEQPMYLQGDDDVTIKGFTPKAFTPMGFTPKGATPKGGSGYPFATPKAFSPGVGLWRATTGMCTSAPLSTSLIARVAAYPSNTGICGGVGGKWGQVGGGRLAAGGYGCDAQEHIPRKVDEEGAEGV
ncbi:unnamed protein product [Closterium sp. NIES-65]|nr:unnamed protein product [Closterium sp. NIES-65]CAI5976802.1 unnamed protein product [Closterium sp. NIES-65]